MRKLTGHQFTTKTEIYIYRCSVIYSRSIFLTMEGYNRDLELKTVNHQAQTSIINVFRTLQIRCKQAG